MKHLETNLEILKKIKNKANIENLKVNDSKIEETNIYKATITDLG